MIDKATPACLARVALVALALFSWSGVAAFAQSEDVFEVAGVGIDEMAANEVEAKYSGIAKAQRQALAVVFRRLVPPDSYGRLPNVSDDELAGMVRDFDIGDEKFGGGRYIATLSVRFLPEGVQNSLRLAGVAFAMEGSRPVVVVPVIDTGAARRLWDDPNPWRQAWAGLLPNPGLFSLLLPAGDLSDIATVDDRQALAGDPLALRAIAEKYQASGAVVAVATPGKTSSGAISVRVALKFVGGGYNGVTMDRSYQGVAGAGLTQVLGQVAQEVIRELEENWKAQHLLDFSRQERISVLVPIQGLDKWLAIRSRLNGMARIQTIEVARMTRAEAEVDLVYVGTTDQLRSALAQQGLSLEYSPDHPLWVLRPSAGW